MRSTIVIDANIPYIPNELADQFHIVRLPGEAITRAHLRAGQALLVRTRTRCNAELLSGTPVQFIGTATAGTDHIDQAYCQQAGISIASAPGCNALGVVQWVAAALDQIAKRSAKPIEELTVGIVGFGHIGRRLHALLTHFGLNVLVSDPPLYDLALPIPGNPTLLPLQDLIRSVDVLTLHVPLTRSGPHPTHHLINAQSLLYRQKPGLYILNSSRGAVVDTAALKETHRRGLIAGVGLDVYESEPQLTEWELEHALITTPHIAGYTKQGKFRGTRTILEALAQHLQRPIPLPEPTENPQSPETTAVAPHVLPPPTLSKIAASYDIQADSDALKAHPDQLEQLRKNYPLRNEPPWPFPLT